MWHIIPVLMLCRTPFPDSRASSSSALTIGSRRTTHALRRRGLPQANRVAGKLGRTYSTRQALRQPPPWPRSSVLPRPPPVLPPLGQFLVPGCHLNRSRQPPTAKLALRLPDPTHSPQLTGESTRLPSFSVDLSWTCSETILPAALTSTLVAGSTPNDTNDPIDPLARCVPKPTASANAFMLSLVPPPLFGMA